jgi:transcriptional regulator with XRE-family HTH domain
MTTPDTLAERAALEIRAEIGRQQRSSASLARELGWSKMYLSRRLSGEMPLNLVDVERIADALHVPIRQLMPLKVVAA